MKQSMEANTKESQSQATDERRYRHWRRNANTIAVGNLLTNMGWNAAFAFLPLIVKDMNTGGRLELWVGMISFGYFWMSFLFTPVWGVLADHYGRKSMVLRAGLGMGVGFTLTSFVNDPLHLLLALMLVGLANGYIPAGQVLVATNTPHDKAGGALAYTQSLAWIGNMLGPMAGAVLIGYLSRPGDLFILAGVTTMSAGLLVLFLVREGHVRPAHSLQFNMRADLKRLWQVPQLKLLYYMNLIFAFTVFGANAVVSLLAMQLLEAMPGYGGYSVATWIAAPAVGFTIVSVVVLPVWGRVLNRNDPTRVLKWQLAGSFATSLLVPLVQDPLQLTLARVLFAVFVAGLTPTLIRMVRERAPCGMDARTLSYGAAVQNIGTAIAPLVAGVMAPYLGLRAYFVLASGMLLLALVLWGRVARQSDPEQR